MDLGMWDYFLELIDIVMLSFVVAWLLLVVRECRVDSEFWWCFGDLRLCSIRFTIRNDFLELIDVVLRRFGLAWFYC
jgi:hypothetical protein